MADSAAVPVRRASFDRGTLRRFAVPLAFTAVVLLIVIATLSGAIARGDVLYNVFVDPFVLMVEAPDLLIQTLWEGFVSGVLYALIALGFVLIFKASGVFNFAQGAMVLFAALAMARFAEWLPRWLGF